jgi:small-conductance mechanosensitive channel
VSYETPLSCTFLTGCVVFKTLLIHSNTGGDDIEVKIPNSKLSGQKFSNISRMRRSRIKFDLKFNIYDMHRVQEIASSIKQEILDACPKLITDGSRPFRVIWTDVGDDHLVVTVHTHHNVPPSCTEHWATREQVLYAIARATEKLGVKFAMPVCVNADFRVSE